MSILLLPFDCLSATVEVAPLCRSSALKVGSSFAFNSILKNIIRDPFLINIPSKCSFMYFCGRIASLQCAYRTLATKQKHRALFVMEHAVTRMRHTTPCTCERATLAQNAGANFSAATTHKHCYNDNSDSHLSSRLQSKGRRHSTSESDAMHRR